MGGLAMQQWAQAIKVGCGSYWPSERHVASLEVLGQDRRTDMKNSAGFGRKPRVASSKPEADLELRVV